MSDLKTFITSFNFSHPKWDALPVGWPECSLSGLSSSEVGKFNAIKMLWEMQQQKKPQSKSRVWDDSKGFRFLACWSNAVLFRILARKWLEWLRESRGNYRKLAGPLNSPNSSSKTLNYRLLDRLEAQLLDAIRSTIANIEEGFARPTTSEYLQFLGYSQASHAESTGDIQRAVQDGLLNSIPGNCLADLGIDLKEWNEWARDPGNASKLEDFPLKSPKLSYNPLKESKGVYRNLEEIHGSAMTYEQFMELCNKTDYLLRQLVLSLEDKLNEDRKVYQIEQSRIKSNLQFR